MHQGLSIAAAAVAAGRQAEVFVFWWALQRMAMGTLDEPDFGPGREEVGQRFERRGLPTLRSLLQYLKESKLCAVYGCTGSLAAVVDEPPGMEPLLDGFLGWSAILRLTSGVADRFYL